MSSVELKSRGKFVDLLREFGSGEGRDGGEIGRPVEKKTTRGVVFAVWDDESGEGRKLGGGVVNETGSGELVPGGKQVGEGRVGVLLRGWCRHWEREGIVSDNVPFICVGGLV
jgi:hypothetical protein